MQRWDVGGIGWRSGGRKVRGIGIGVVVAGFVVPFACHET